MDLDKKLDLLGRKEKPVREKSTVAGWLIRAVLILNALAVVYPLFWNILTSLKTNKEILLSPWRLPEGFYFQNYLNAFTKAKMGEYFLNSALVVGLSLVLLFVFTIPFSYVLAKFQFRLAKTLKNIYIACIFIQPAYIIVPLFLTMTGLGMQDNLIWLSVVYAVLQFPFTIFLLTGYMKSIPGEYEEAAMIDGASYFRVLFSIIMPMTKPGIITASILSFFCFWNEYPLALTLLSSESKKTIPVGLANLFEVQRYATDWGALFAALVLVLLPTVLIYAFSQKQLTLGMNVGGLKG